MCLSFSMLAPLCGLFPRTPWDSASLLGPLLLGRTCADGPYSSSGIGTTDQATTCSQSPGLSVWSQWKAHLRL